MKQKKRGSPLMRALADGRNAVVTVTVVPEADHGFTTGSLYEKGEQPPGVVEGLAAWISELLAG